MVPVFVFLLLLSFASTDDGVFDIDYPSVVIYAQKNGNVSLQSGNVKDLYLDPGPQGSVIIDGDDLLHIIEMAKSLPPVWSEHSHVGFFGTFEGQQAVNIQLKAVDPEGGKLLYQLVAGNLPPGINLDENTGKITGTVPDETETHSFTIRVIDQHRKYADAVFKMETIGKAHCITNPCNNRGICDETRAHNWCNCSAGYGGENCELTCVTNALGVRYSSKIPDAQLSGYLTYSNSYPATNGRYGGSGYGWCGSNANSWFQVDLGNLIDIYKVTVQGYSTTYYTTSYTLATSVDGNVFSAVNDTNGNIHSFSAYNGIRTYNLPVVTTARFVRFHPTAYHTLPCLKVELYGCPLEN